MSGVKEFSSPEKQVFFEIALGETNVSSQNFSNTYKSLFKPSDVVSAKNQVIREALKLVQKVFYETYFSEEDVSKLCSNDLDSFKIKAPEGSKLKDAEEIIKKISEYCNSLSFTYSVSFALIEFLIERENELADKINALQKKYGVVEKEVVPLEIKKFDDTILTQLDEEKQEQFVEQDFSEEQNEVVEGKVDGNIEEE